MYVGAGVKLDAASRRKTGASKARTGRLELWFEGRKGGFVARGKRLPAQVTGNGTGSGVWLLAHAIGRSPDDDRLGMMQQAVEQGGSEGAVVVEDLWPLLERAILRNDCRAALIALADDLEEAIGAKLIDREIAQFVDAEECGFEQSGHLAFDTAGCLGGGQRIDDVDGGSEERRQALEAV